MQSAAELLFAQNLTIEVCDIEKVEGHLYVAIYQFAGNIYEETLDRLPDRCERYVALHSLPGVTYGYVCHFALFQDENGTGNWILPFSAFLQRSTGSAMMLKALWVCRLMTNAASLFPKTRLW